MESQENQTTTDGQEQSVPTDSTSVSQAVGQLAVAPAPGSVETKRGKPAGLHGLSMVILGLAVLVLVALLGLFVFTSTDSGKTIDETRNINTNEYQALFLTNGQVYFGKLADLNDKYVTITDVYYLQVQQSQNLQQGSAADNSGAQVSLAKLGNELHGPEDKMYVSSQQVLFWENLKNNSKVVQAIQKYQSQQ